VSKRSSQQSSQPCDRKSNSTPQKQRRSPKQRLLQPIFEHARDAIALIDATGRFVDANATACRLFGLPHEALIGRSLPEFTAARSSFESLLVGIKTKRPQTGKLHLSGPGKLQRSVEYTLTPDVSPGCHLLILRDLGGRAEATEDELRRQRQRVELFSEVTLKIRQSLQLKEILHTTVTEVQRILQADRVLIYQVLADGTGKTISEAVLPDFPALLNIEFPEEVFPVDYQQLYAQGRVRQITDVHDAAGGLAECLVEFVDQFDIKAKLIVPILQNLPSHIQGAFPAQNQLWGLLIAHQCKSPRHWVDFELELMQQLADQISIALAQAQLLGHLEDMVEARTVELKNVNHNLKQEINDRMQAEAALRQSEEQLRLITNALPVLIAYVDDQQQYRFNNKAYRDWLGQSPDEIYGCHLQQVWGDFYQRMQPHVEAALAGQVVTYENDVVFYDGSLRSVDITYIPHFDEQKTVKGFFALTSDISDRKAIERMKDEFISVVSHELRTPLTSLHSALKILATGQLGSLSADGQQMLEIADDSAERLVRLVNNVLDLQRIESGKVIMDRHAYNAADLMIQATEAMQPMAQQLEVALITKPVNIPIWVDADYILQALTNLLSNAIKFSSQGGKVWLTIEYWEREVLFRVRDEGQGIPADKLESIFERFHQVDSSDSRKKGGTGLGLAICRKIIEQHGGRIWAESVPGQGSTFSFTLPALNE
jgi:two-component system sensor histidine kinase VicK